MTFCSNYHIGIFIYCRILHYILIKTDCYFISLLKTGFIYVIFPVINHLTGKSKKFSQFQNFFTNMSSAGNNYFFIWSENFYKSFYSTAALHFQITVRCQTVFKISVCILLQSFHSFSGNKIFYLSSADRTVCLAVFPNKHKRAGITRCRAPYIG